MQLSISLRPKKFSEVYGQPSIIKEMEKRKVTKNWPSAILLKGQSGTGKTTVAQIIAMVLNCEHPDSNGDPCGTCSSCRSIISESFDRDTQCIDGSRSSKGEVVDFTETMDISPLYDRNHIIIIEESDQLSKEAKTSLLKVLEKPQEHTYFILLSMENLGLPPAIQSRCQVFNFNSFTNSDIMYGLKGAMENLGLWSSPDIPKSFKIEGLKAIAESSMGSLRSAIQYLEKCLIGEYWTAQEIKDNLGIISYDIAVNLVDLLLKADPNFLVEFEKVDIKEFFDYTYTIISSTFAHKVSNYTNVREEFVLATKRMGEEENLLPLLKVYDEIFSSSSYLKKSFVTSKFAQFIYNNKKDIKRVVRRING